MLSTGSTNQIDNIIVKDGCGLYIFRLCYLKTKKNDFSGFHDLNDVGSWSWCSHSFHLEMIDLSFGVY